MDKNMIMLPGTAAMLPYLTHGKSRAINAENRTGEKGKGGMAASVLGKSRKGSPCLNDIQPFLGTWFSECIGMARKIHQ